MWVRKAYGRARRRSFKNPERTFAVCEPLFTRATASGGLSATIAALRAEVDHPVRLGDDVEVVIVIGDDRGR